MGGLESVLAGLLADRIVRTTVTIVAMAVSDSCALAIGFTFGGEPWVVAVLAMVWGLTIVADSAQFSAAVSELSPPGRTGTALTLQTSLGFLLTLITIWLIPPLVNLVGWRWAFVGLSVGPAIGIWAMATLRRSPAAVRLAGGRG